MSVLTDDYALCADCHGETHQDDMRGKHCKWCFVTKNEDYPEFDLGGEG